jgi:glycosyltransferase involved in cell wall biosynthesis
VVEAGDPDGLARALRTLAEDRELAESFGAAGRDRFLGENTADAHYAALMGAYGEVLEASRPPASG